MANYYKQCKCGAYCHDDPCYNCLDADNKQLKVVVASLCDAIKELRAEAEDMRGGETCDHSVNICWCDYFRLIERVDNITTNAEGGEVNVYTGANKTS